MSGYFSRRATDEAFVTEHVIVPDIAVDDFAITVGKHTVKFVGLAATAGFNRESDEHRVVVRFSLPIDLARNICAKLADELRHEEQHGEVRREIVRAQSRDKTMDN